MGFWVAEYSERPIDGERRDRILNAPDATGTRNECGRPMMETALAKVPEMQPPHSTSRNRGARAGLASSREEVVRYSSPKRVRSLEKPELGAEVASEGEALIKAFQSKNGVNLCPFIAYKAEAEIQGGSPIIGETAPGEIGPHKVSTDSKRRQPEIRLMSLL